MLWLNARHDERFKHPWSMGHIVVLCVIIEKKNHEVMIVKP